MTITECNEHMSKWVNDVKSRSLLDFCWLFISGLPSSLMFRISADHQLSRRRWRLWFAAWLNGSPKTGPRWVARARPYSQWLTAHSRRQQLVLQQPSVQTHSAVTHFTDMKRREAEFFIHVSVVLDFYGVYNKCFRCSVLLFFFSLICTKCLKRHSRGKWSWK